MKNGQNIHIFDQEVFTEHLQEQMCFLLSFVMFNHMSLNLYILRIDKANDNVDPDYNQERNLE